MAIAVELSFNTGVGDVGDPTNAGELIGAPPAADEPAVSASNSVSSLIFL